MGMLAGQENNGLVIAFQRNSSLRNLSGLIVSSRLTATAAIATLVILFSLFCINSTFAATAAADEQQSQDMDFDHLSTGYALEGQHQFIECGQCHINGVFKGTPLVCNGCHDGSIAKGKSATHVPTEEQCDLCHTTSTILEANATMDHSTISSSCISCHDGLFTIGKSVRHVDTTNVCEACHSTVIFVPAIDVDHVQVIGTCQGCHNGLISTGKSPSHQPTTDLCEACHTTTGWVPPVRPVDHSQTLGVCSGCHNGQITIGKGPAHIETTNVCEACHLNTLIFVPVPPVAVEHDEIINGDTDCARSGCHENGISAKSASHIATTNDCGACHKATNFVVVAAADVDHNEVLGSCFSCHNGTSVPGKTAAHPINMTDTCDACHQPGPVAWTPVAAQSVDHNEILNVDNCIVCHNGTVAGGTSGKHTDPNFLTSNNCGACHTVGSAWAPVASNDVDHFEVLNTCLNCHNGTTAIGKDVGHVATTSDCDVCHSTAGWTPASVAAAHNAPTFDIAQCGISCHIPPGLNGRSKPPTHIASSDVCGACHATNAFSPTRLVDHDEIAAAALCVSCHFPASTFSSFSKANDPNHIASSDTCDACHSTNTFKPAVQVDHAEVIGVCSSCHNGTISTGVTPDHIPIAAQECDVCHATTGWIPTSFDHANLNFTAQPCASCHNGVTATGKPANHIAISADDCAGCHNPNVGGWKVILTVDHGLVIGTCVSCHNGVTSLGKNPRHIASTDICEACHNNTTSFTPVLGPNVDHNEVLGSCNTCHDGVISTGKTPTHPATTNMCDACHSPGAWSPVVVVDHNEVIGSCVRCHDGTIALGKDAGHVNTSNICQACHNTTIFAPVFQVDHNEVTGNCIDCHNGTIAIGKDADHANTSNTCEACHNTNAFRPVANVDHNEVIGTCSACHNGTVARGEGNGHFVYTGLECSDCHTTTRWAISSTYSHGIAGTEYPRPEHRFGNLNCTRCHTQNTSTIPAGLTSCARCHENDYDPGEHRNAPVSSLQDCSGACHEPGPEHRANDGGW